DRCSSRRTPREGRTRGPGRLDASGLGGPQQREALREGDLALPDELELAELRALERDVSRERARAPVDELELFLARAHEPGHCRILHQRAADVRNAAPFEAALR